MNILKIFSPSSLDEAKGILRDYEKCMVLTDETDFNLDNKKNEKEESCLVSLKNIDELKKIKSFSHHIIIGSRVNFSDLMNSNEITSNFNCLKQNLEAMNSLQIRKIETLGENITKATTDGGVIPCLLVLDSVFEFESYNSRRLINATDYFENYKEKKMKDNEILKEIVIQKSKGKSGFCKLENTDYLQLEKLSCAIYIERTRKFQKIRIALELEAHLPFRLFTLEKEIENKDIEYAFSDECMDILEKCVYEKLKSKGNVKSYMENSKAIFKECLKKMIEQE